MGSVSMDWSVIPARHYSRADIERWLGAAEVRKGEAYLRAVSRLEVGADRISGLVRGTAPRPYRTSIHFVSDMHDGFRPMTACSCPRAGPCKHVAALLLAGIEHPANRGAVNPLGVERIEAVRR